MDYRRCGLSGLLLPRLSYGLWHGFSDDCDLDLGRSLLRTAFDMGINHFDVANVYGPPNGLAEERLGQILKADFGGRRDELVIATKAGYRMWDGPFGEGCSRKHLVACAEQSLSRLQLDRIDIFYCHRYDPNTTFEETAAALCDLVRSGKVLYVGISNHNGEQSCRMAECLKAEGVPLLINQVENSMLVPFKAMDVLPTLDQYGVGATVFAPVAGGRLSDKYLNGIPADSRAARNHYLKTENITEELVVLVQALNHLAEERGQSLPQMALTWAMRHGSVCSALIGASKPEQIRLNCQVLEQADLTDCELERIKVLLDAYHGESVDL